MFLHFCSSSRVPQQEQCYLHRQAPKPGLTFCRDADASLLIKMASLAVEFKTFTDLAIPTISFSAPP